MTSHDVRDMLDLPGEAAPRPIKKAKLTGPRPVLKGLAREVQNLGGDNPIAIVPETTTFKKKRFGSRKPAAKWENQSFRNSAREDETLVLKHWRRKAESPAVAPGDEGTAAPNEVKLEDSTFAKYNVKVITAEYNDEQYQKHLLSEDWSRDETDYLVSMVRDYDMRWPVIWDRYEYQPPAITLDPQAAELAIVTASKPRTLEDLKARYYSVAATMMKVHKAPETMVAAEYELMEKMASFNPQQEAQRKLFAEAAFQRTREEAREEESLLIELKRILARSEKLSEERRELYARLDAPASTGNIGVFTTSQGLQQLLQQLMQADKTKKRKSLMGPDGTSPAGPSGLNQQASFDRRDSTVRGESISGPSGTNNKKGPSQGQTERRQLSAEEEILYGVRHFDRITSSGPAFRAERINKPITSKSSIQQQKMLSVLTELGIPHRLIMPTYAVGEAFDHLLTNINLLLEQRKVTEKIQSEINTILAIKKQKEEEAESKQILRQPEAVSGSGDVKVEEVEREKSAAPSINGRKRSASVMSAVSESTKRQKK
ncbi:SWR1-complex protein 4 [Mollisia scopiformis]|uniref:SWR1-complex protein 4 n=1 Tax=Mollisia scopiformis TaxID=149040 RepID=A0A194X643_MOLSC|nr:SWR1-complex protein 4 [Mollisia scopiformis]KUJ15653.1 SWR1-complex protein 4 [Mollisia scopiformis]